MNRAIQQMFRIRRQREGEKLEEPFYPPNMDLTAAPLSFAYTRRQEQQQRLNRYIPPAFDPNELVELPTSYKPDAELDPIPQSDFYYAGNKIRPWAHVRVPTYLAIPEWEAVSDDEFKSGKIFMGQLVGQYALKQQPIDVMPIIPEVEYTTYGALNQLSEGAISQIPAEDGYLYG